MVRILDEFDVLPYDFLSFLLRGRRLSVRVYTADDWKSRVG